MILDRDLRRELMIDIKSGKRYTRALSRDELFEVVMERYSAVDPTLAQTEYLSQKLNEFGFGDAEIFDRLMFKAAGLER